MCEKPFLQNQDSRIISSPASAKAKSASVDHTGPDDTIVLDRRPKIPSDPLVASKVILTSSEAYSGYQPSQESDSDRERSANTRIWRKASRSLRELKMPAVKRPNLKEIRFADGDIELQQFPQHLLQALEQNCRDLRSKTPTCTRAFNNERISLHQGREAFFQLETTGERLLQAKYKYDKHRQILVVKERAGETINRGRAVIVTASAGGPQPLIIDGVRYSACRYQIWSPFTMVRYSPKTISNIVRLIKTESESNAADETSPRPIDVQASAQCQPQQSPKPSNDGQDAQASLSTPVAAQGWSLDPQDVIMGEDPDSSDSDTPLMVSAQRKRTTKDPALQATEDRTSKSSPRLRIPNQHNQQPQADLASAWSTPSTERYSFYSATLSTPTRMTRTVPSSTPASTTSVSSGPNGRGPIFVFKKGEGCPTLRSKSATICNSIEKLFAQANVSGITNKSSLMLHLSAVTDTISKSGTVIRGDPEDFEAFMQGMKNCEGVEIIVMPGDE